MQEVAALYPDRAVFDHADKGRFNTFEKVSGSRQYTRALLETEPLGGHTRLLV